MSAARAAPLTLLTLLALGTLSAARAAAQADSAGTVRGLVLAAATGEPVPRALVTVSGRGSGTTTDEAGRFVFRGLPAGAATVRVRAFGFRPQEQQVAVPRGAVVQLTVRMELAPVTLRPVRTDVRAVERDRFERSPDVGVVSISANTLSSVPAVGEADVLRTVQLMPGVLARNDFDAGYNARGGESDQNLVLLDGIPVYNPFHLGGLFGTFIDDAVADADLQLGGFGAGFGGRLSSVLDVSSKEEARGGVHGTLGVSLLATTAAFGGATPGANGSWNLAGRRTYVDVLSRKFGDQVLPYHFSDGQLHVAHHLPRGGILSVTAYAGTDLLDGDVADTGDSTNVAGGTFVFTWGNQLAGLTWYQPLALPVGDSASFVQRASVTRFATTLDLGDGSFVFRNSVRDLRLAGSVTAHGRAHSPSVGYEAAQHRVRYGIFSEQTTASFFHLAQQPVSLAAFAEDAWRVTERLLVRPGVRVERQSGRGWTGVSPRLAAKYWLTKDLALTAAGGEYAQWMHGVRNEDLPVRIFDFWVASDRWIPVSKARQAIAGGEAWIGPTRFVRVEAYHKRYTGLIEPDSADDPAVRGDEFHAVRGSSFGVDLLARQLEAGPLSGWVAYTLGVSRRERGGSRYAPAQDRRHNLNVVASWRTRSRYVLGARFGLGTGLPFTDIVSQIVRRTYDPVRDQWNSGGADAELDPVGGERNARRYPLYHRLDLSVSRAIVRQKATFTPSLQLVNAYNRRNVFIYTFDYTGNPPTREARSQFPILPSVGLTVEF